MNKFVNGIIAGMVVGSAASVAVNNMNNSSGAKKQDPKKSIGKTLHSLGDMAENLGK